MFCSGVASAPSLLGPKVRGSVSGRKVVGWLEEKGEGRRGAEGRRGRVGPRTALVAAKRQLNAHCNQ